MSNSYKDDARLWTLDDDDILSRKNKTDAGSGLVSTCVRMVRYRPATTGQSVQFQTLNTSDTPTLAISVDTYSVTSTYRITDTSTGAVFNGATAGDWVNIYSSSSGNNLGWYLIDGVDGSKHYIDVAYGTAPLSNDTSENYEINIYTPEVCMILVSMTSSADAEVKTEVIDWGENGRTFTNLAMYPISGGTCDVYLS